MESHESSSWQFHVTDDEVVRSLAVLYVVTSVHLIHYVGQIPLKLGFEGSFLMVFTRPRH